MSLVLATGSNLKNKLENLKQACEVLSREFEFIAASDVFKSEAIEYIDQPDFYNQVLEFKLPDCNPLDVMKRILIIEKNLGRERIIDKGPRIIDIDIIFWGLSNINIQELTVPHISWQERSFVVRPMQQLPFFKTIEKCFKIPHAFEVEAYKVEDNLIN